MLHASILDRFKNIAMTTNVVKDGNGDNIRVQHNVFVYFLRVFLNGLAVVISGYAFISYISESGQSTYSDIENISYLLTFIGISIFLSGCALHIERRCLTATILMAGGLMMAMSTFF